MEPDLELQNIIDEYVKQINAKEDDLLGIKRNIDSVTAFADSEMQNITNQLERKFDANEISEEEYLAELKLQKDAILIRSKEKLDLVISNYQKIYQTLGK